MCVLDAARNTGFLTVAVNGNLPRCIIRTTKITSVSIRIRFIETLYGDEAHLVPPAQFLAAAFQVAYGSNTRKLYHNNIVAAAFCLNDFCGSVPATNFAAVWERQDPLRNLLACIHHQKTVDLNPIVNWSALSQQELDQLCGALQSSSWLTTLKLGNLTQDTKEKWNAVIRAAVSNSTLDMLQLSHTVSTGDPKSLGIHVSKPWLTKKLPSEAIKGITVSVELQKCEELVKDVFGIIERYPNLRSYSKAPPIGFDCMPSAIPLRVRGLKTSRKSASIQLSTQKDRPNGYMDRLEKLRQAYSDISSDQWENLGFMLPKTRSKILECFLIRSNHDSKKESIKDRFDLAYAHVWKNILSFLMEKDVGNVARSGINLGAVAAACDLRENRHNVPFVGVHYGAMFRVHKGQVPKTFEEVVGLMRLAEGGGDFRNYNAYGRMHGRALYEDLRRVGWDGPWKKFVEKYKCLLKL